MRTLKYTQLAFENVFKGKDGVWKKVFLYYQKLLIKFLAARKD